jgi:uncharacterized integral membrane protein
MGNGSAPEADYSPSTSVEVKNEWSYTSTVIMYLRVLTSYLKILLKTNATHEMAWVFQIFRCSEKTCFTESAKMLGVGDKFAGETGIYFRLNEFLAGN